MVRVFKITNLALAALVALHLGIAGALTSACTAAHRKPDSNPDHNAATAAPLPGENEAASAMAHLGASRWDEPDRIVPTDGAEGDEFGDSVAIWGDTAVVGARTHDIAGFNSGAVYVFTRAGRIWTEQAKLTSSDAAAEDRLGHHYIAIWGDTLVAGAHNKNHNGRASGSAYVFARTGDAWTEQARLTASDTEAADHFGVALALGGDSLVVGAVKPLASGAAYLFTRSGGTWTERAKLTPSDGEIDDRFGVSVAISGDTVVVGARNHDAKGTDSGSAYVFTRDGAAWAQQAKLTAGDGAAGDQFGVAVAISGDTVVVGARFDDDDGADSGSAYVFTRSGATWTERAKLTANDAAAGARFGEPLAIEGDLIAVGARGDVAIAGAAYLFTGSGAIWTEQKKLIAGESAAGNLFGTGLAVHAGDVIVGARADKVDDVRSGSAYYFGRDAAVPGMKD